MDAATALSWAPGIVAGLWLAGIFDRSGLTLDRVFRGAALTGEPEALHGWMLAAALVWLVYAGLALAPDMSIRRFAPAYSPIAALLGGFLCGVAVSVLADDPFTLALGAGRTRSAALAAFPAWVAGLAAAHADPLAGPLARLQRSGPVELQDPSLAALLGLPEWTLPAVAGLGALGWLLRQPVVVRPGRLEWPLAGAALAAIAIGGWVLAAHTGMGQGPAPVLGMLAGLAGAGFLTAWRVRPRGWLPGGRPAWPELVIRIAAGFALGLASALALGHPAIFAAIFLPSLSLAGVIFVAAFGCGAFLMALLEWKARGRPGAAPALGRGV